MSFDDFFNAAPVDNGPAMNQSQPIQNQTPQQGEVPFDDFFGENDNNQITPQNNTQQAPSFLDQMGQNLSQGFSSARDLGALGLQGLGTMIPGPRGLTSQEFADEYHKTFPKMQDLPEMQNLQAKVADGTYTTDDVAKAYLAAGMNQPAGKLLGAIGGISPLGNAGMTAMQKYGNPAIENVTGATPAEVQSAETLLPFLKGKAVANSEVIDNNINTPLPQIKNAIEGQLINPEVAPNDVQLIKQAKGYGIPILRTAMGTNDILNSAQNLSAKLPFSGANTFNKSQQISYNKAVANTFGEKAAKITPDVINNAYQNIGDKFDNFFDKSKTINFSDSDLQKVIDAHDNAPLSVPNDEMSIVNNNFNALYKGIDQNGDINGQLLGNIRSNLTNILRKGNTNANGPLGDLLDTITDTAQRNFPNDPSLSDASRQYRNLKTVQNAVVKNASGDVLPNLLRNQVAKNFSDYGRGGGGDLGNLSRIGTRFLPKNSFSGSGEPMAQAELLSAAAYEKPLATAVLGATGLTLGRKFNSLNQKLGSQYMEKLP